MAAPFDFTINGKELPAPTQVKVVLSGKRDASFIEAQFEGHRALPDLRGDCNVTYNGAAFHVWCCTGVKQINKNGVLSSSVNFRIGPWRLSAGVRAANNVTLGAELLQGIQDEPNALGPLLRPLVNFNAQIPTTQLAYYNQLLHGGDANAAQLSGSLLAYHLDLIITAAGLLFDDVAAALFEKFMLLTVLNPDYRIGATPLLSLHSVLDPIVGATYDIDNWLSFDRDYNPSVLHNELVQTAFKVGDTSFGADFAASDFALDNAGLVITNVAPTYNAAGMLTNTPSPLFGHSPARATGETDDAYRARLFQIRYFTPFLHIDYNQAKIAAELIQHDLYRQNRQVGISFLTPASTADLLKLYPGRAVNVKGAATGGGDLKCWITELNIDYKQSDAGKGVTSLDLFIPMETAGPPRPVTI